MTDGTATESSDLDESGTESRFNFTGSAAVAVAVGVALAWTARTGALPLLVAIAVVQALLAFAWALGLHLPGRVGGLVVAALTAGAADAAVSVWPHSRLGPLLAVVGLAVPVLFVHQLLRGAGRVRVLQSLGGIAVLVLAEACLPALLQLRHEFAGSDGGDVVFGVAVAGAGALLVGYLTDLVVSTPRFDASVPRGLPAVVLSTAAGAAAAHLVLRDLHEFAGGRGAFIGAALGALIALAAVGVAFVEQTTPMPESGFPRRVRPVLGVVVPLALICPVALLLCLAIRVS